MIVEATGNFAISKVEFYINNLLKFIDMEFPYMFLWNTTFYLDGKYFLKVLAYDYSVAIAEDDVFVNINNTSKDLPPSVSIISPINHSVVFGDVEVEASVIDDKGVNKVEFYLNDNLEVIKTEPPYMWLCDTTQYINGEYTIKVIVYDTLNQIDIVDTIGVIVSNVDTYSNDVRNYPNPFKYGEITEIKFKIEKVSTNLEVNIYDLSGKLIRTLEVIEKSNNRYLALWDAKDKDGNFVPIGIYM